VAAYRSPFVTPLPRGAGGPALARRVVLVVVDGLRLDASRTMATLNALRERGADFTAWTGEPSLSYPGWTVIGSGATQEVSAVTTNWYEGPVPVDHLFASAASARLRTGIAGGPGWATLFGAVDARVLVKDPEDYADLAAAHRTSADATEGALDLLAQDVQLLLLHLPAVDIVGHGFGGASPQYAEAVRRTDDHLARLLQAVDLAETTVIVTADHGHTDAGGHGGWEPVVKRVPLVLAGAGVRRGVQGHDVRQADIAPTVAALLGIPIPSHSQGRPLVEALDGDLSTLPRRWAEQQRNFYGYVAGFLGHQPLASLFTDARLRALHDDGPDGIVALADEIAGEYAAGRALRLERERRRRLPIAVGVAFIPLIYLALHGRKRVLLPAAFGAAAFFAVDYGLFFARGYSFSLSVFNSESLIQQFFQRRLSDAAIAVFAGALLAGLLTARGRMGDAARAGLDTGILVAYALLLQVLFFFWQWDLSFAWYLPDLRAGFKYYLDLLKMVPVGILAPGYVLIAVVGRGMARTLFASR